MSLDTIIVSFYPHVTVKDGKMDQCIASSFKRNFGTDKS